MESKLRDAVKGIEHDAKFFDEGVIYDENLKVLLDLARSYLSAIEKGVPEKIGICGTVNIFDEKKMLGWNACHDVFLPHLVEKDNCIRLLQIANANLRKDWDDQERKIEDLKSVIKTATERTEKLKVDLEHQLSNKMTREEVRHIILLALNEEAQRNNQPVHPYSDCCSCGRCHLANIITDAILEKCRFVDVKKMTRERLVEIIFKAQREFNILGMVGAEKLADLLMEEWGVLKRSS
jgi:hypothetical protein